VLPVACAAGISAIVESMANLRLVPEPANLKFNYPFFEGNNDSLGSVDGIEFGFYIVDVEIDDPLASIQDQ